MKDSKSKYNFTQVYSLWVHGRCINDVDQHFPVDCSIVNEREWHSDFDKAYKDFINAVVKDEHEEGSFNKDIFKDYIVTLYVIDIDIDKFEKEYCIEFDLKNKEVQDSIPYYDDYKFTTVAERINNFEI